MAESLGLTTSPTDPLNRIVQEVRALSKNPNPENASWKPLKRVLMEAATFLRLEAHQTSRYAELNGIAQLRRIKRVEFFQDSSAPETVLTSVPEGFIVRLRPNLSPVRHRASIAHEIGHTFFYDLDLSPPTRLFAKPSSAISQKEEGVCWAFARELLMPRGFVVAEQKDHKDMVGLDLLSHLADCFGVSLKLAAFHLLWDLSELDNTVVIFREAKIRRTQGNANPPRRYFGKAVRRRLRKNEKEALELVTEVIDKGMSFQALDMIASRFHSILNLQWKVSANQYYQGIVALLSFRR